MKPIFVNYCVEPTPSIQKIHKNNYEILCLTTNRAPFIFVNFSKQHALCDIDDFSLFVWMEWKFVFVRILSLLMITYALIVCFDAVAATSILNDS